MTTNRDRARRANRALDHTAFISGSEEPTPTIVTDLVADIGHFCVEHDLT